MLKRRVSKKRFNRKFNKRKTRSLRRRTSRKRTLRRRIRGGSNLDDSNRCEMTKMNPSAPGEIIQCGDNHIDGKKYCSRHACPQCENVKSSLNDKCDYHLACDICNGGNVCASGGTNTGAAAAQGGSSEACTAPEFNECAVCMDLKADHAIHPCGHLLCFGCAKKIIDGNMDCPICGAKIYISPPLKIFL